MRGFLAWTRWLRGYPVRSVEVPELVDHPEPFVARLWLHHQQPGWTARLPPSTKGVVVLGRDVSQNLTQVVHELGQQRPGIEVLGLMFGALDLAAVPAALPGLGALYLDAGMNLTGHLQSPTLAELGISSRGRLSELLDVIGAGGLPALRHLATSYAGSTDYPGAWSQDELVELMARLGPLQSLDLGQVPDATGALAALAQTQAARIGWLGVTDWRPQPADDAVLARFPQLRSVEFRATRMRYGPDELIERRRAEALARFERLRGVYPALTWEFVEDPQEGDDEVLGVPERTPVRPAPTSTDPAVEAELDEIYADPTRGVPTLLDLVADDDPDFREWDWDAQSPLEFPITEFAGLPVVNAPTSDERVVVRFESELDEPEAFAGWLARLEHPEAVAGFVYGGENLYFDEDADAVTAALASWPRLTALFLGELPTDDWPPAWASGVDLGPLLAACAGRLEHLWVRGDGWSLPAFDSSRLRELAWQCPDTDEAAIEALLRLPLDRLESLCVWFGEADLDDEAALHRRLLGAARLPALTRLWLGNTSHGDAAVEALADSPLLPQLRHLDLSLGTVGKRGVKLLRSGSFAHLETLNLDHHYATRKTVAALKKALPNTVVSARWRQDPLGQDRDDPDDRQCLLG